MKTTCRSALFDLVVPVLEDLGCKIVAVRDVHLLPIDRHRHVIIVEASTKIMTV